MSEVVESNSVLVLDQPPPMRSIPAGDCQDTCQARPSDREWDHSHSPLKVWHLLAASTPPHVVREDCV